MNWESIQENIFDLGKERVQITQSEFGEFLHSIPDEDKDFVDYDMCKDPMGGFIQKITNTLIYSLISKKYIHQVVIERGPIRLDNPERIYQLDGLANKIFIEGEYKR